MPRNMSLKLAMLLSASCLVFFSGESRAETAQPDAPAEGGQARTEGPDPYEIIVTARKREESLISVPVNVSALSSKTIEDYNLDSLGKVSDAIPFVDVIQRGTGAVFSVRGIGSSPVDSGLPQSVSVVIDGLQVNQGNFSTLALFDVAQVQVMKGPQALFFGKNSPAGVVQITSADPGSSWELNAKGAYEFNAREKLIDLAAGGPLSPTLGVRAAVRYRNMSGYLRNEVADFTDPVLGIPVAGGEQRTPRAREIDGRLTLVWSPGADFTAKLKVSGSDLKTGNPAYGTVEFRCAEGQETPTMIVPDVQNQCGLRRTNAVAAFPEIMLTNIPVSERGLYGKQKTVTATLNLDYSLGDISLVSTSAFGHYKVEGLANFSGAVFPYLGGLLTEKYDIYQQEIRVESDFRGPLNFTLGGFIEHTELGTSGYRFLGPLGPSPAGNWFGVFSAPRQRGDSYSLFAEGRLELTAELEISGGLRYSHDVRKLDRLGNALVHPALSAVLLPEGIVLDGRFEDNNISPEVTLSYKPSSDTLIYAAYKSGYKAGGFGMPNVIYASQTAQGSQFRSETVEGFELGVKGALGGAGPRYQVTAYNYIYEDLQTVAFVNGALGLSYVYGNAPRARIRGLEFQFDWLVGSNLTLRASGGYNEARYRSYPGAPCYTLLAVSQPGCTQDLSGKRLPNSSDFSADFGFSYKQPVGRLVIETFADVNYQSKQNISGVLNPAATVGELARINGGIAIGPQDGPWTVKVFGRNLTDKFRALSVDDKPRGKPGELIAQSVNRPREIWIELGFRY